jgi:hypothetical protein
MTQEQRLDRLERIAKLMVNAGLRGRRAIREHDDKINHLADLQISNEDKFAQLAASHANLAESHANLAESHAILADSHAKTDRRLDALIDMIKEGRNGKSSQNT